MSDEENPVIRGIIAMPHISMKTGTRPAAAPDPVWEMDLGWPHGHGETDSLTDPPEIAVFTSLRELHECGSRLLSAVCLWMGEPDAEFWHDTDTLRVGARTKDGARWEFLEGSWARCRGG